MKERYAKIVERIVLGFEIETIPDHFYDWFKPEVRRSKYADAVLFVYDPLDTGDFKKEKCAEHMRLMRLIFHHPIKAFERYDYVLKGVWLKKLDVMFVYPMMINGQLKTPPKQYIRDAIGKLGVNPEKVYEML